MVWRGSWAGRLLGTMTCMEDFELDFRGMYWAPIDNGATNMSRGVVSYLDN